jgi:hypothetical protein
MLVGIGNPLGIRNPHGYGFGQNFIPVMGMGFLAGVFFLRGYGFGQVIPSGFIPVAISMYTYVLDDKCFVVRASGCRRCCSSERMGREKATSGTVKGLLPLGSIDETTRLVLGNALYFRGAWARELDASETRDGEFHLLDGSSVEAPFMSSIDDDHVHCIVRRLAQAPVRARR